MPGFMRALAGLLVVVPWLGGCTTAGGVLEQGNLGARPGTGFMIKTVQNEGRQRKYALFIPHAYDSRKAWPVIMFLHGLGECGTDARRNLTVGLGPEVAERAATFPFIVVFPQTDGGNWNEESDAAADAIAALRQVRRDYHTDPGRIWLTGCSIGGYGTWAIGAKYKDQFTGLVPLCPFTDFTDVDRLTDLPIWCFHNTADPFVISAGSHAMCDRINDNGGHAQYTEYLAFGHDVWVRAYQKDELFNWMLKTRRSSFARSPARPTITASVTAAPVATPAPLPPADRSAYIAQVSTVTANRPAYLALPESPVPLRTTPPAWSDPR